MGGMIATMTVEAAANGTIFVTYLEQVLLPELRRRKPDAVLVMDNRRVHTTAQVRAALDRSEFVYRYLPAYSPDLSPIEPAWAKVKSVLRRVGARTTESLQEALGPALDSITPQDAVGCFHHCGYFCLN
jgi:transposase